MTRRSGADDGSLDLLLDTICNTFGGVLFISMLVVILLNMSSRRIAIEPPDFEAQAALVERERERSTTAERLRTLREALAVQREIERRIDDPALRAAVARLREAQTIHETRTALVDEARARISRTQIEINAAARSLAATRAALEQARSDLARAARDLESELALRTRTAKLPRLRETTKTEIGFFLRSGRLCALRRIAPGGRIVLNTAESRLVTIPGGEAVEPIVAAGTTVGSDPQSLAGIERKLREFDPDRHFIALVVWSDSFGQFAAVKDVLVRLRFEYRLLPWPDDEPIGLGDSTSRVLVQ